MLEPSKKIRVVLFSGGRGTKSITESLLRQSQIELYILINAYDDGHSTGRLRRFIPGMLGPSDVRKNVARLMPEGEGCFDALKALSDFRLPRAMSYADGMSLVSAFLSDSVNRLPESLASRFVHLTFQQLMTLKRWLFAFHTYASERARATSYFDFSDCAIGNLFFAGCFLSTGDDFNCAIGEFCIFHQLRARLLNVTAGENLFLVATKEDGVVLRSESEIVSAQSSSRIDQIFLVDEETYRSTIEPQSTGIEEVRRALRTHQSFPAINPDAKEILESADLIIYGPGTQHSSLFPSYMTIGVAEAIAANSRAEKVFVGNARKDHDIQFDDAGSLAAKFLHYMTRASTARVAPSDLVTHFFFHRPDEYGAAANDGVPFEPHGFPFGSSRIVVMDWEAREGQHSGGRVLEELQNIVQPKLDRSLSSVHELLSIVVPARNEESTIETALRQLNLLDFSELGLSKEIIVVDGGSSDRTAAMAAAVPGVKVVSLAENRGRGSAIRVGIKRAKGSIVALFPADTEYKANDLALAVDAAARGGFQAVFGSRAIKCVNLNVRIKSIYGHDWLSYILSKYGGMFLSTLTLLLFNRYVADPLTSIKVFRGSLLRQLDLKCSGVDLDLELIAKVSRRSHFILEVPVDYSPRSREGGKKTTPWDGFRAIWALLRYRFSD